MKTLWIVRHAKAEAIDWTKKDYDRKLKTSGKEDASKVAEKLKKNKLPLDIIICSSAKRTYETAIVFAKTFNVDVSQIIPLDHLYNADYLRYQVVLESLDPRYKNIMIIGHNPGITDFANKQAVASIDDMPTSGAFGVSYNIENWQLAATSEKQFLGFYSPNFDF
ncbi:SixA phosphatase family protein [Polluticaenibacter yanchengensis]|uniref:Histidine phosphatase family protein n=1 Tax=Polluticaenibacter yanchengensis TaxID=3014562 RepID=A0ABT4UH04_9BACT|nr:histidine phosphatase family protein [Chitinophagaceae bacterium LY-5]